MKLHKYKSVKRVLDIEDMGTGVATQISEFSYKIAWDDGRTPRTVDEDEVSKMAQDLYQFEPLILAGHFDELKLIQTI